MSVERRHPTVDSLDELRGRAQSGPKKAMILAAGHGTRLRPFTDSLPKCMVPIDGKPIVEYAVETLRRCGVTEIVMNLSYLPDVVMNHFGDGSRWGVRITYSFEERPLGTAGGVRKVAHFFTDGPFFVWYGDNLSTCDPRRLFAFHRAKGGLASIALFSRDDPTSSGIIGLDGDDCITRFVEKPRPDEVFSHWVNAGIYVLEPGVIEFIPPVGTPDFGHDIFPKLLSQGAPLYGYRMSASEGLWWVDTPEDLQRVQKLRSLE